MGGAVIKLIAGSLLAIVVAVLVFTALRRPERYVALEEVIPGGDVISQEEGIIEFKGARYVLGTNDLRTKKHLLEKLDLLEIGRSVIVDMRYTGQIIVRDRNGT